MIDTFRLTPLVTEHNNIAINSRRKSTKNIPFLFTRVELLYIFFIGQNRSSNLRSGMILEVQIQNFGARGRGARRRAGNSLIRSFLVSDLSDSLMVAHIW